MSEAFLAASIADDRARLPGLLGAAVPSVWPDVALSVLALSADRLRLDPGSRPWGMRAMVRRADRLMIGHAGFHEPPGAESAERYAPGGVELGYTVFEEHRRQGYAREAGTALLAWARLQHGVGRFLVSIRPDNRPSLRVAWSLGFRIAGAHQDEVEGTRLVLVADR